MTDRFHFYILLKVLEVLRNECLSYCAGIKYRLQVASVVSSLIVIKLMRAKQPRLIYRFVIIIHEGIGCTFRRCTNAGVELLICKELPRCLF